MNYAMYLITGDGREIPIPVLPEKLEISSPGKNEIATVLGLGEVLLLRTKGLRTITWDSHFPKHSAPYVTGQVVTPIEIVRAIQAARDSRKPMRFLLLGSDLDINMPVGVDDFSYEERGGEVGDIYYSIKLTEWKNYAAKRLVLHEVTGETPKALEAPATRSGTPPTPKTYTVQPGDSLWAIAQRSYGNGAKWKTIYEANQKIVGANPNQLRPRQVLAIP